MMEKVTSFRRAAWECSIGALRRESRPTSCVYGTQRVGTRGKAFYSHEDTKFISSCSSCLRGENYFLARFIWIYLIINEKTLDA